MNAITEKQAARYCERTLNNAAKRLIEQQAKYGGDFPYIESVLQEAIDKLHDKADDLSEVAVDQ
jgi:hypothetical protein